MKNETPTPRERLEHILKAINDIQSFVSEMDENEFVYKNLMAQDAVLYKFMIIGEAIIHVEREILKKYDYPWHLVRSFRNFIAHAYHKIRLERVWNTTQELDELKAVIETILENEF